MSADQVMAYLWSVPKPLKRIKKIIENLLTNGTRCAIMCIQGKGAVKVIGSNGYQVDKGGTEIPLKKSLTNPLTCDIIKMFQEEQKKSNYERGSYYG
jgi:hypothetical protein